MSKARKTVGSVLSYLTYLDIYGDSVKVDPAKFPKSIEGVIVSLACIGITLTLIILDIMRLVNAMSGVRMSFEDDGL